MHDAFVALSPEVPTPIFRESVDKVVYVARDPRDVCLSLARHLGRSNDEVVQILADPQYAFGSARRSTDHYIPQRLSSWSVHVESWLGWAGLPAHLVRYEDLLADPLSAFSGLLAFLGMKPPAQVLSRAVDAARFSALSQKESASGFVEKPSGEHRFFHGGRSGAWRTELTATQAEAIVSSHHRMMRRLGYLF